MHLFRRDANHKHLYLLANGHAKTGATNGGVRKREKEREKEREKVKRKERRSERSKINLYSLLLLPSGL